MIEQQTCSETGLRILAANADDGAAGAVGIVVDEADQFLLPVLQHQRLANELTLGNKTDLLDKRDDVGSGDPVITLRALRLAPGHP